MHVLNVPAEALFQALSDPTRIRILRLIADSKDEACLCEISDSLNEPEYKLSRHVKVLRQAGLLSAEKEGRWIYHSLVNSPNLNALYKFIQSLPDSGKRYQLDLKRFNKRRKTRLEGRCRIENANIKEKTKKVK